MSDIRVATRIDETTIAEPRTRERRRRPRVKLSMPVRVRSRNVTTEIFAEVCTTMDVSPGGMRFLTAREGYWHGLQLAITFPYSGAPHANTAEQQAVVIRVNGLPNNKFSVALRFHEDAAGTGAGRASTRLPAASQALLIAPPLIIAVDQDDRSRSALIFALEKEGYEVQAFRTPPAAFKVLRERMPAILIADVESDEMSGYDLCLILKSDQRLEHVPVVLTTRNGLPSDYATAHALGAIICMTKPYKPDRLLQVARLLAPPPARGQPAEVRRDVPRVEMVQ